MNELAGKRMFIPFGREDGIVAQRPEERFYGPQKRHIVQLTVTLGGQSIRCIVPAYCLRDIADCFDPQEEAHLTM